MSGHETVQAHDKLLRELTEERAAALTRIGRTLDGLIQQLRASAERLRRLGGPERTAELATYRSLRDQAARYRWYLDVQREALGLRHHETVDQYYEVSGPVEM